MREAIEIGLSPDPPDSSFREEPQAIGTPSDRNTKRSGLSAETPENLRNRGLSA